jgi:hypothetical protein
LAASFNLGAPTMAVTFSQALEAAQVQYSADAWIRLTPAEQLAAIYRQMRLLDLQHANRHRIDAAPSPRSMERKPRGRRFEPPPII